MNIFQFKKLTFFSIFFLLSGCASLMKGSRTGVSVRSDYSDAKIYLSLDGGYTSEFQGVGHSVVCLDKSKLSFVRLIAKKKGCKDGIVEISSRIDSTFFLNFLLPPFFIYFAVDLVTGAYHRPVSSVYIVNPICPSNAKGEGLLS